MMYRFGRVFTLCVFCLFLSSCSTFGFLFERLPWLSEWQASRMFDLDDTQEQAVGVVAKDMQRWLRTEGFPDLLDDLQYYERSWREKADADEVIALFGTLEKNTDRFLVQLGPKLAPVMMRLNQQNFASYESYLDDKKKDWFEALGSEEDKEDQRIERIENWFGRLNDHQELLVRRHIRLLDNELAIRHQNTDSWSNALEQHVFAGDEQGVKAWLEDPSIWWTQDYAALRSENRLMIDSMLKELVPSLTEKQKKRASSEIQNWIEELQDVTEDA